MFSADWQPTASLETLKKRSQWLQQLRAFFYARQVMEVDTPMLSQAATPDLHLRSLSTQVQIPGEAESQTYYLHTSPEYPMKRLLCAGSGDIFYLGKVFRDGDVSRRHQVEFTMLEWYRLGFSMQDLIAETAELIQSILGDLPLQQLTYQQAFQTFAGIDDIHHATAQACRDCLARHQVPEIIGVDADDKPLWEQLILTEVIEPQLGQDGLHCITHYPAREAALAQINPENPDEALRFEFFVQGMELANGYQELQEGDVYQQRFEADLQQRQHLNLPTMPMDARLLSALQNEPLPNCAGVALGVDRLFQLALGQADIAQVVPFSTSRA